MTSRDSEQSDQRLAVSVRSAATLTDLSEATIRLAINQQALPAYRVGRAIRILVADLEAWIARVPVGSADGDAPTATDQPVRRMTPSEYGRWLARQGPPATKATLEAAARIIAASQAPTR